MSNSRFKYAVLSEKKRPGIIIVRTRYDEVKISVHCIDRTMNQINDHIAYALNNAPFIYIMDNIFNIREIISITGVENEYFTINKKD